jgi:hypothetical protein
MDFDPSAISPYPAKLPYTALIKMRRLVRTLFRLSQRPAYLAALQGLLPESARFDPGYDAVMMGYDFHLDPDGRPQLIEVNTNAGGAIFAYKAAFPEADPDLPLPGHFPQRFLASFREEYRRYAGSASALSLMVIVDEQPLQQNLYPEMFFLRNFFRSRGLRVEICDPSELQADRDGVFLAGQRVDMLYNRHCDFYLEQPEMAGIRAAYLNRAVCLSPNPRAYGLLADKQRLTLWSDRTFLSAVGVSSRGRDLIREVIPHSELLAGQDPDQVWERRSQLVFKPLTLFGGKGVLMGKSISRKRFGELDPQSTLLQQLVPPSMTPGGTDGELKTDYRLFVYRNRLIGASARLYRGQLTNLRTPGGGFARVDITRH